MNKTIYTAAILSAALFSAASFAGVDNDEDVLYGNGSLSASPATPYVRVDSGPQGTESDLLSNLDEIESQGVISPYQRVSDDRDNRGNLTDRVS